LVASGAGAAGAGMPVLCNGANLAFTKSTWLQSQGDLHNEELSGDDVFLLLSIKKRGGVIRFLKSESAIVKTESAKSFGDFIKQRKRWASKSPSYTDWQLIYTACVVFTMGLLPLILLTSSIIEPNFWHLFSVVIIFKYLIDLVLLYSVQRFFHLKRVWFYALILSVIYPFYIVMVGLSAILLKQKNWK
jgi:cellulose synthase/poly-beta-1,6-N-acetylglucosamine synthase-like glycosyltransferase